MQSIRVLTTGLVFILITHQVMAESLSVSPTSLALIDPSSTTLLTLKNEGQDIINGQIRVMRWIQEAGKETLLPTTNVVASPPALKLILGKERTIRLVRVSREPINSEECYRVLVDQLPGAEQGEALIKFTIRQSIPLCFDAAKQMHGQIDWQLKRNGNSYSLFGANSSQRRIVAKFVTITFSDGTKESLPVAVVLGGSSMSWPLHKQLQNQISGSNFILNATINGERITVRGRVVGT